MSASFPSGDADSNRDDESDEQPARRQTRQAAGIYGLIVTAAVLASGGTHLRTAALALAVIVTLAVYWLAEEYARLVEHASNGHLPSWPHIRGALAEKWPMVSASYLPLLVLVAARLFASPSESAYIALGVTVLLLTWYGLSAGRASGLHGIALALMTIAAGSLGLLMVLLKVVIAHIH